MFALVDLIGEDIVVPEPGARCNSRHVIHVDAIHHSSLSSHAGSDSCRVSAMALDGMCVGTLVAGIVIKYLGHNHLGRDVLAVLVCVMRIAICSIAFREAGWIAETGWIEEGMRLQDTGVDIANLDTCSRIRSAACSIPGVHGINDFVTLTQVRIVKRVVLGAQHHGCGFDCREWRPVELNCHRVKRHVVLACDLCSGRVCVQPLFELIALSVQLGAVRSHSVALEIDFPAVSRLGGSIGTYWIALELHDGARFIDIGTAVGSISVSISSRRAAYSECDNAQANG